MFPYEIVMGGMGVGITNAFYVREFCEASKILGINALGVVSLTAIADVAVRRLQMGDRRMLPALDAFPVWEVSQWIKKEYFIDGGKAPSEPFASLPMFDLEPSEKLQWLTIWASFAEVWLAKQGTGNQVAANLLEKIQVSVIFAMFGAMLAGVRGFVIGAGLPTQVPGVIDAILDRRPVSYKIFVANAPKDSEFSVSLDIEKLLGKYSEESRQRLAETQDREFKTRPFFTPIVTLDSTASIILRQRKFYKPFTIDGFTVEEKIAGGHNAPPRGWKGETNIYGEPEYGPRDEVRYDKISELGYPFICAGGYGNEGGIERALANGACGIQMGTILALGRGSGIVNSLRLNLLEQVFEGKIIIRSNPKISPSGFPFQTVAFPGSFSDPAVRNTRQRICDLGYLRQPFYYEDGQGVGRIGWRCPAENVAVYVSKGGKIEDTEGAACVCNGLTATNGLPQVRKNGYVERMIITSGKDISGIRRLIRNGNDYGVMDALKLVTHRR